MEEICIGAYTEEMLMSKAGRSIIPQLIRNNSTKERLIVLYGPWMEGVHDVLLDAVISGGVVCLRSTEQLILPPNIHWIFKMHSIGSTPRHRMAQCRTIQLNEEHVTWNCLVQSWMTTIPAALHFLENLFDLFLTPILDYNSALGLSSSGYHPIKAVKHMLTLIKTLAEGPMDTLNKKQLTLDYELRTCIQSTFLFAVLWTLAVPAYLDDKRRFDVFFRRLMDVALKNGHVSATAVLPTAGSVFDYKLLVESSKCTWQLWSDDLQVLNFL